MSIKEYEGLLAVELREVLRKYSPILEEQYITLIIEFKDPINDEITTIREPRP